MKAPLDWIKEFVDFRDPARDLGEKLTMAGTEVSGLESHGKEYVFDLDILPNRGDCLSIVGIAREIGAILGKPLKMPKVRVKESLKPAALSASVEIKAPGLCPRYMARIIEGGKIKDSPEWLQNRLKLVGIRPINNVVDVTNYCLIERGQPMHAFDLKFLAGQKIIVRRAKDGEAVITLDGVSRKLTEADLVISDKEKCVALAGIMGAQNSEVTEATTSILLESAFFDPPAINKTSKRLKLRSESSSRFERGVDWDMVSIALDKAAMMIADLSGGKVLRGRIDKIASPFKKPIINLRFDRIKSMLGVEISPHEAKKILKLLGFTIRKDDKQKKHLVVEVLGARAFDVTREIDLIEEIARIFGYKHVPSSMPGTASTQEDKNREIKISTARNTVLAAGLDEICTYSMVSEKDIGQEQAIRLSNPLTVDQSVMRTSLLPGLLKVLLHNQRRQEKDISIFEIGKVFFADQKSMPEEKICLAGVISGNLWSSEVNLKANADFGFEYVKGLVENVLQALRVEGHKIASCAKEFMHPGKSANAEIKGREIAVFGALHPKVLADNDISGEVFYFEIDLEYLLGLPVSLSKFVPLTKFPAVERDIAMLAPRSIQNAEVVSLIHQTGKTLIENVSLFDHYSGKPIPEDKVSLAYRIIYRDREKTLKDEEVNLLHQQISQELEKKLGVEVRR